MSIWSYVDAMISVTLDKSFEITKTETGNEYIKKLLSFALIIEGSEGKAQYHGFLEDGYNSIEYRKGEGHFNHIYKQNRAIIIIKGRLRDLDQNVTQRYYDEFVKFLKYNCYIDDEYVKIYDNFNECLQVKKSNEFIMSYDNIYEYLKQTSISHIEMINKFMSGEIVANDTRALFNTKVFESKNPKNNHFFVLYDFDKDEFIKYFKAEFNDLHEFIKHLKSKIEVLNLFTSDDEIIKYLENNDIHICAMMNDEFERFNKSKTNENEFYKFVDLTWNII